MDKQMHSKQLLGHVHQQAGTVICQNFQCRLEFLPDFPSPIGTYPTLRFRGIFNSGRYIGTIPLVDRNAKSSGDKTDNIVSRQRITAFREFNQTVVHALHQYASCGSFGFWRLLGLRLSCLLTGLLGLLGSFFGFIVFLSNTRHDLPKLDAAIADSSVQIVQRVTAVPLAYRIHQALQQLIRKLNIIPAELPLQFGTAFYNIFLPAFLFEPLTNLVPGLTGLDNLQPVAAGTMTHFLGGQNLDDFAGLYFIINRDDTFIHLSPDHSVAYRAMNGIGKIDDGRPGGQTDNLPLGGENKDLLWSQVAFNGSDNISGVLAVFLIFQHLANPHQPLI